MLKQDLKYDNLNVETGLKRTFNHCLKHAFCYQLSILNNYLKFKSVKLFLSCVYGCLRDNHSLFGNPFVSSVCVTAKSASFVIFRVNRRLQVCLMGY
jgi:hypothetical protein